MHPMTQQKPRYRSVSVWLKEVFGEPVRKITLDAGLGCPNRDGTIGSDGCIFCNARGSGTGAWGRGSTIGEQVDRGIESLSRRYGCRKFIAYLQSFSNTYGGLDKLARIYGETTERPEIVGLAIGTRPDCVPDSVLDMIAELSRNRMVWIELGLQSMHEKTLKLIRRCHGLDAFLDAVNRASKRGIPVVAHLIVGLPGETIEDMRETALAVTRARVHGAKLHPLYVVRGTMLETMWHQGNYRTLSQEEAALATISMMEALGPEIVVHRITSDPHPEELVAPAWMLNRRVVRNHLEDTMRRMNFLQGSRLNSGTLEKSETGRK